MNHPFTSCENIEFEIRTLNSAKVIDKRLKEEKVIDIRWKAPPDRFGNLWQTVLLLNEGNTRELVEALRACAHDHGWEVDW